MVGCVMDFGHDFPITCAFPEIPVKLACQVNPDTECLLFLNACRCCAMSCNSRQITLFEKYLAKCYVTAFKF